MPADYLYYSVPSITIVKIFTAEITGCKRKINKSEVNVYSTTFYVRDRETTRT
jgi:hypothetical protein